MKITFDTNKVLLYGFAAIGVGLVLYVAFKFGQVLLVGYACAHSGGC
jgi:hypothetical protein